MMKFLLLMVGLLIVSVNALSETHVCPSPTQTTIAPKATSNIIIEANLNLDSQISTPNVDGTIDGFTIATTAYDNAGDLILISFFYTKTMPNTWDFSVFTDDIDTGSSNELVNQSILFNNEGQLISDSRFEVIYNNQPITIDISGLTQTNTETALICISQDSWLSYKPRYEKDNLLAIPILRVNADEYYYINLVGMSDNSFKIISTQSLAFVIEDEENTPYYDIEKKIAYIPSLINTLDNTKYRVELHQNDDGNYEVVNLIKLD